MRKDLRICLQEARANGAELPTSVVPSGARARSLRWPSPDAAFLSIARGVSAFSPATVSRLQLQEARGIVYYVGDRRGREWLHGVALETAPPGQVARLVLADAAVAKSGGDRLKLADQRPTR